MGDEHPEETLLQFPCRFPIKAIGTHGPGFESHVVEIIRRHAPGDAQLEVSSCSSAGGRFLAVTVVIEAESKAQLDSIYRDLVASTRVRMAL